MVHPPSNYTIPHFLVIIDIDPFYYVSIHCEPLLLVEVLVHVIHILMFLTPNFSNEINQLVKQKITMFKMLINRHCG